MRTNHRTIRCLAFALALGVALSVQAQTNQDFTPSSTDMAVKFIDVLIGKTDGATTIVSALAAGMEKFNVAALTFGTLLFSYIAVVGTLRTAENGELLGKKWSSMWIPLRFSAGVALLVPLASGYSTAQHGMIWLAKQGSGVASAVWKASAHYIDTGADRPMWQLSNPQFKTALDASLRNVWRAEACAAAFRDRYSLTEQQFGLKVDYDSTDRSYLLQWGDVTPNRSTGWGPAQCGSVRTASYVSAADKAASSTLDDNGFQLQAYEPPNPADQKASEQALKLIISYQASALQQAAAALRPSASAAVRPCGAAGEMACADPTAAEASVTSAVENAKNNYIAIIEKPLRNAYQSVVGNQKLEGRITDAGWVMAGTAMFTAAKVTTEINKLRDWAPAVLPPGDGAAPLDQVAGDVYSVSWMSEMAAKSRDVSNTAGRGIAQWISYTLAGDPRDKRHILVQMKDGGDSIMVATQTAVAVLYAGKAVGADKVVSAATKVASNAGGKAVADLLGKLGEGAMIGAVVLFITGVVMSLVIPMMPFVLWAGSVAGWLVAVLEAIIAAPLWVAAHLHPDGEDLTGQASTGYMILLEVLLRPTFMVLGLVAALALIDVLGRWIGYAFWATTDAVQDDSWTGLASIVTLVIIYVGLTFTVTRTCFGLVHDVPATIMRWVGGANATHDKGEAFGQAAQGQINQGLQRAEAPVLGVMTRKASGPGGESGGQSSEEIAAKRPRDGGGME